VTLSFNLLPGYSLGEATSAVDELVRELVPPTVSARLPGRGAAVPVVDAGARPAAGACDPRHLHGAGESCTRASFTLHDPVGAPLAGVGALLTLLLFRTELSLYAFVGVIMLVGW